jgi:hypothetical protein
MSEPVGHPLERLTFLPVTRPAPVVTAMPRPDPLAVEGFLVCFEPLGSSGGPDVHAASLALPCAIDLRVFGDVSASGTDAANPGALPVTAPQA